MTCQYQGFGKEDRFSDLVESVQHCDICTRLCGRKKVLSPANGSLESRVLFVAEAPGRLGADRTGIPLYGDRTGDNFETLLSNIGWHREDIFITNAILCNPKQENGNNDTPTTDEIVNCSPYLEMVIALVRPEVVVSLGTTALSALQFICPHGVELRDGVAQLTPWRGTHLFPLYHPGPRALVHRPLPKQRSDFMRLCKIVDPVKGLIHKRKPKLPPPALCASAISTMQQVAQALMDLCGQMAYFKMTKLMYLVDLFALERLGHTIASNIYLRQVDGPWPPELDKALQAMHGHEIRRFFVRSIPMIAPGPSPRFSVTLGDDILDIVTEVSRKYGMMTNAQIKTAVYRTAPVQFILREERKGRNMMNKPVLYKDKDVRSLGEPEE